MKNKKYLYLVRCNNSNFYKIGVSRNPEERLVFLQVGCPYPLILIYKKSLGDPLRIEKALHKKYQSKRKIGEWFKLSKSEIELIQQEQGIIDLLLKLIPELNRIQTINKIRAIDGLPPIKL